MTRTDMTERSTESLMETEECIGESGFHCNTTWPTVNIVYREFVTLSSVF